MKLTALFETTLEALVGAKTMQALTTLLYDLRDAYGLANLVYHAVNIPVCPKPNPILALSYDPIWVKRYVTEDYFSIDPVVQTGRRGFLPLDWMRLDRSSNSARHLFKEADSYGVGRQGVTIPIHGPGGERAMFTLTSNVSDDEWTRLKPEYLRECHATAHYFHDCALRLSGLREDGPPKLSTRERQCLQLLARGQKAKVSANRLGISEAAVRLYLTSARHKLGCPTMTQAVAKAITLELIEC